MKDRIWWIRAADRVHRAALHLGMQTLGQGINKKFSDISSSLNAS